VGHVQDPRSNAVLAGYGPGAHDWQTGRGSICGRIRGGIGEVGVLVDESMQQRGRRDHWHDLSSVSGGETAGEKEKQMGMEMPRKLVKLARQNGKKEEAWWSRERRVFLL
jgi:hypothetical protein